MKITDLMHGDWFDSPKGTCRINEIKLFTAIVEFSDEAYQTNGNISATELDFEYNLKPIPPEERDPHLHEHIQAELPAFLEFLQHPIGEKLFPTKHQSSNQ